MKTVWIFGDQLSPTNAALVAYPDARVLMIESKARGGFIKYHQQKLVLIYSGMRHFARDLRAAGREVDYHLLENTPEFERAFREHLAQFQPESVVLAEPNDFLMTEVAQKIGKKCGVRIEFVPTTQFLLPRAEFQKWARGKQRLLMEDHYRRMRKRTGYLMKDGKPVGNVWNLDPENRRTHRQWEKETESQAPHRALRWPADEITREVIEIVAREFADHPGRAEDFWLPVDRAGALRWLKNFVAHRLGSFGPYEDIMDQKEPVLFHSVLSPLLNLGLLSPQECAEAAVRAYEAGKAPLASVEGFVRQIIGWREFINGVYWHRGPEYKELNALGAERPLPTWFYTADTPMNCLHRVLSQTLHMGWNHHIQRLMVLGNFMLIAGIHPRAGFNWFLEMYVDAYDWVMAANVIGMILHADGGYMATKPYAATSTYIRRMSDYCRHCAFDPDEKTGPKACPFNYLYWDFIDRHSDRFAANQRMKMIVQAWLKRGERDRQAVRESAAAFLAEHVPES